MSPSELFFYDCGKLYWAVPRGYRIKPGDLAGTKHRTGYIQIGCNGKFYQRSRLIWEMHNGPVPDGFEVDHINAVRDDDRIENLQLLTHEENVLKGGIQTGRSHNSSGFTGVFWNKRLSKWQARITISGKQVHLGLFDSAEKAYLARINFENSIDLKIA